MMTDPSELLKEHQIRRCTFSNGGTLLVALLVEALRYKPDGRGFDFRWCHWNFSLT